MELLYLAKNLNQFETISRRREINRGERLAALTEEQQEVVDRWSTLFEQEIKLVRQVRNTVAHQPYLASLEEMREATEIGRKLLRDLLTGIRASADVIEHFEARSHGEPGAGERNEPPSSHD